MGFGSIWNWILRREDRVQLRDDGTLSGVVFIGGGSEAGIVVDRPMAMELSIVMSAMSCLVSDVGQIPLEIWEERYVADKKDPGKKRRMQYPATWTREYNRFAYGPNKYQTAQQWRENIMWHLLVFSDYLARRDDVGGYWDALHSLDNPASVTIQRVNGAKRFTLSQMDAGLAPGTYGSDRIFHIAGPSPDGYRGRDFVAANQQTLGLAYAMLRHGATFFANGAQPAAILILPPGTKEADRRKAKAAYLKNFGGKNLYKVAAFSHGTDIKPLTVDPEKSQLHESRQQVNRELAGLWRVPMWRIYQDTPPTPAAWKDYVLFCLAPWLWRISGACEKELLGAPPDGQEARFYLAWLTERLLELDYEALMRSLGMGIDKRILNPNEARYKLGMNPYDGGDEYLNPNTTAFEQPTSETP